MRWKNELLSKRGLIGIGVAVAAIGSLVVMRWLKRDAAPVVHNPAGGARTKKQRRKARLHDARRGSDAS